MDRRKLNVALAERAYPIHIGEALLSDVGLLASLIPGKEVMLVSNASVADLYGQQIKDVLTAQQGFKLSTFLLPEGESYKRLDVLEPLYAALLEQGFSRSCTLVALGGGVIGDMVGFVAATYQRGVNLIQLPTTLLAQVDSSVGGKTAVNHALGKNMIGAFYQPKAVIIDICVLNSLPQRELVAGIAEIIKYGLIWDADFYAWLESNMQKLLRRDPDALVYAVERSCSIKALVVAQDERESGVRALLNLGHTFGHAVEAGLGFGVWLHGEAVGLGMLMAADLSARMGLIAVSDVQRIYDLLTQAGLPTARPNQLCIQDYLKFIAVDKKVVENKLRFVLLSAIGEAFVDEAVPAALLRQTLDQGESFVCQTQNSTQN